MALSPAPVTVTGQRRATFGIVAVVSLVAFEAFAVITALPAALADLGAIAAYGPAFGVYLTASLFASVICGAAVDRRGPLPPFIGGAVAFAAGSLLVGLAPTAAALLTGRAAQGLGAGLLVVVLYVLAARRFPPTARPAVFAAMASAWVVPSIAGPPIAALITVHAGWRWIFAAVPLALAPAIAVLLPHVRSCGGPPPDQDDPVRFSRIAGLAAGTAAGGVVLQYAMTARSPVVMFGCGAVAVGVLAATVPRLLPPGTLRARPGLPALVLLRGVLAGAFFGTEILLPLMLVRERGASAVVAGLVLASGSVGWAVGSWLQARPAYRQSARTLPAAGCLLLAAGILAAAAGLSDRLPPAAIATGWLLAGVGMGAGMTAVNRHALEAAPPARHGGTSSALQVSDGLASTLTTGLCAAIVTTWAAAPAVRFHTAFLVMAGLAIAGTVVAARQA
ncbi:MFS transporter [Phytohabitans flavus]|uniref:MFS transporter n=1 Tax=Phytohabitans flavus TaxID=1076124 RepID=A0A6F8XN27_9ACTN|nr:MFS transporter [Phytohabitans flavus]